MEMDARQRVLAALDHRETDRVPFDLGGTVDSGIHVEAYRRLMHQLGLDAARPVTCAEQIMNIALVDDDVAELLQIDTTPALLYVVAADAYYCHQGTEGDHHVLLDPFQVRWLKPVSNGLYYDSRTPPLAARDLTEQTIPTFSWPDFSKPRFVSAVQQAAAERAHNTSRAVVLGGCDAGIFERATWLRGFQNVLIDLHTRPEVAGRFLEAITDVHIRYWDAVLDVAAKWVDVAVFSDDLGTQERPMVSPDWYRRHLKPHHRRLFSFIKGKAPHVRIFFHTCGAVYELIEDLIDAGIDILNPLQLSAAGMDPAKLKREFKGELVLWGGAVDSQITLPRGSTQQVRDETKRNLDVLAPGGGYVCSPVHNIQPDVPIENIMAMWETIDSYGAYR